MIYRIFKNLLSPTFKNKASMLRKKEYQLKIYLALNKFQQKQQILINISLFYNKLFFKSC